LRRLKINKYTSLLAVAIVGLGVCSYHVRELLLALVVFSVGFGVLALAALVAVILWWASERIASKTGPASRRVLAFSRRILALYARP
jgi:hypothetical protein